MTFTESEANNINAVKQTLKVFVCDIIKSDFGTKIFDLVESYCFISGGSIASLLNCEEPNDYDIYFKDVNSAKLVRDSILDYHHNLIAKFDPKYATAGNEKIITQNAITMKNRIQFMSSIWAGQPLEITKTFDYLHCTPYYDFASNNLFISEKIYRAIKDKKLYNNGNNEPKANRKLKYLHRGWKPVETDTNHYKEIYSPASAVAISTLASQVTSAHAALNEHISGLLDEMAHDYVRLINKGNLWNK